MNERDDGRFWFCLHCLRRVEGDVAGVLWCDGDMNGFGDVACVWILDMHACLMCVFVCVQDALWRRMDGFERLLWSRLRSCHVCYGYV